MKGNETEQTDFLLIDRSGISRLMHLEVALHCAELALRKTSNGVAKQDVRRTLALPGAAGSCLSLMYADLEDQPLFGAKVLSVFPENFAHGHGSHRGVVVLFEKKHGRPVGLIDGGELTGWRTAAASAVATRALSRPDSACMTLMGYGEQARRHIATISTVRPIRKLHIWGRDLDRAEAFAAEQRAAGFEAVAFANPAEAVTAADIICTVTSSQTPVLAGAWLPEGVHVNAVGASVPSCRELDTDCVTRSGVWVDYMPMALTSAGELVDAISTGQIGPSDLRGEIGAVLEGDIAGRCDDREITLYRSLGVPAQDIELANFLYAAARREGFGTDVEFSL
ncbi:ornithine cyclodeaminase family protein [Paracoccus pantotrophus]|uniref:ornithine cyclodeaminase family protein n=1 Tax=Paracoccus pantotrophus TaxID=82367 RepID=UPI000E093552|nr:ornithine cyclodeaminase family protein [Paracoccus pantotrophus]RDD95291.1 ornithine cyclodeaminase family protein [Paracoccus pantotrophus]WGR64182.1 ornithine cyclodeaminase family protein [Paracoccus pantotrophus]